MKLTRPPIYQGQWNFSEKHNGVFAEDGTCITGLPPTPHLPHEEAFARAAAALPEVMDFLEELESEGHPQEGMDTYFALQNHRLRARELMMKMGYKEEADGIDM